MFFLISIMLASHCPEVDTRWSYEYGILNFARNSPRTLISTNQQQKSLRCLPRSHDCTRTQHGGSEKVFRRQHGDVILSTIFTRRRFDGLTHPELLYTYRDVRFDNTIALIRLTNCLPLTMTVIIGQVTKIFRSQCVG